MSTQNNELTKQVPAPDHNQNPNLVNDRCIIAESVNYPSEWS